MSDAATVSLSKDDDIDAMPAIRDQAGPWPRFWSRLVDINIWAFVLGMIVTLLFPEFAQQEAFTRSGGDALFGAFLLPFALIGDAFILAAFGNTPGRALAGIRVETIRHEQLSLLTAFKRNLRIYFHGLALGFPLFTLVTLSNSFKRLKTQQTSWDEALFTRVYATSNNTARTILVAILALGANVIGAAISASERANPSNAYDYEQSADSGSSTDPIAEQLAKNAATIEPGMIDEITRLDSADAAGRTLTYHYTLLRRDVTDEQFKEFFYNTNVPKLCAKSEVITDLRDYQITYRFEYSMPNAASPLSYDVTWDNCS